MVEANEVFEKDTHVFIGHGWNVKNKYLFLTFQDDLILIL